MENTKELMSVFERVEKTPAWYGETVLNVMDRNFMGDTVLHTVCSWGDYDAVKAVLGGGADVNARGDKGCVPIFNAVIGGNVDIVKALIKSGADLSVTNEWGRNVFEYAKNVSASKEIIGLLGSCGKSKPAR